MRYLISVARSPRISVALLMIAVLAVVVIANGLKQPIDAEQGDRAYLVR